MPLCCGSRVSRLIKRHFYMPDMGCISLEKLSIHSM